MRKVLISIGVFLLAVAMAHGQGGAVSGEAIKSTSGQAASVRVCTSSAISTPCTILADIYADPELSIPKTNPIATDAHGNYSYYAATGEYKEQITALGVTRERRVSVYATKKYVDDSITTGLAPYATTDYVNSVIADTGSSVELWAESDVQTAINSLPASGGMVRLLPNHEYSITCGVNQITTGSKVVRISGAGETTVITGSGCALITLASSGSTLESLTVKQSIANDNTVGVLVASGRTTGDPAQPVEVTRWAIRDVYFESQDKFKGSAIRTIFGLEGYVVGGESRGWNCGIELTSYDTGHRSNANHLMAAKLRWGNKGVCAGTDDIDNLFIAGSVIEGNAVNAIESGSGTIYLTNSHIEQNGDASHPQVELLADARIVSQGNFYGVYPTVGAMDIRTATGNTSPQSSYSDIFNGGITHNGTTRPFVINEPILSPIATAGTGTVIENAATQKTASREDWAYVIAGFAFLDLRSPLVNTTGNTKIAASTGNKVVVSNVTGTSDTLMCDPADKSCVLYGKVTLNAISRGNSVLCQKSDKSIGYCSSVVANDGTCTCN